MGSLDEFKASAFDEGEVPSCEFEFQIERVKLERNRTAISSNGIPSSRNSRIFWAMKRDCAFSPMAWTIEGREPSLFRVKSVLLYFSGADAMMLLANSKIGSVLR